MLQQPTFSSPVELAPNHKTGLILNTPVMTSAGCWGFADEYSNLLDLSKIGAFVTNPITLRARRHSQDTQAVPIQNGTLVHTGTPNPGIRGALSKYRNKWRRLPCPVIVHISASNCRDVEACMNQLEGVDNVAAVELGLQEDAQPNDVKSIIATASGGLLPVLTRLPLMRALDLAWIAEHAGAQALTTAAPPRGTMHNTKGTGWVSGRLYGQFVFPIILDLVRNIHGSVTLPIIASGGIHTCNQAQACLESGASAVQIDSLVWTDLNAVKQIVDPERV